MPIYEYTCEACASRITLFFRSYSLVEEEPRCPRCGEQRLKRRASKAWSHSRTTSERTWNDADDEHAWESTANDWDDPYSPTSPSDEEFEPVAFAQQARAMAAMSGEPLDHEFDQAL